MHSATLVYRIGAVGVVVCAVVGSLLVGAMGLRIMKLRRRMVELLGEVRGWAPMEGTLELRREHQLVRCAHVIATTKSAAERKLKLTEARLLLERIEHDEGGLGVQVTTLSAARPSGDS